MRCALLLLAATRAAAPVVTLRCTDPTASNYAGQSVVNAINAAEAAATTTDYPSTEYDSPANCTYDYIGCTDPGASNYISWADVSWPSPCQYAGCNDTEAT